MVSVMHSGNGLKLALSMRAQEMGGTTLKHACVYVCVCVCVTITRERRRGRKNEKKTKERTLTDPTSLSLSSFTSEMDNN